MKKNLINNSTNGIFNTKEEIFKIVNNHLKVKDNTLKIDINLMPILGTNESLVTILLSEGVRTTKNGWEFYSCDKALGLHVCEKQETVYTNITSNDYSLFVSELLNDIVENYAYSDYYSCYLYKRKKYFEMLPPRFPSGMNFKLHPQYGFEKDLPIFVGDTSPENVVLVYIEEENKPEITDLINNYNDKLKEIINDATKQR
ncbi:MAG: hypothetical protein R3Y13_04975 [bacterium]